MSVQVRSVSAARGGVDEAEIAEHLRSTVLGSYARNHSLIRLGRDASFWNSENEPTLHRLAVFLHEYLHFNHNFSTVVGLYDYFAQLRLARLYCGTVGANGKSHGEQALAPEAKREAHSVLMWRRHLRGSIGRDALSVFRAVKTHPPFAKIVRSPFQAAVGPQLIEGPNVQVVFDVSELGLGIAAAEIELGSEVLMEGCAVEAECQLFERCGASADDVRRQVPAYPYLTARAIFEGIAGFTPTSGFLCRACVLALQCTDPGEAFAQIAETCKREGVNRGEAALLQHFLSASKATFQAAVGRILDDSLQREVESFSARGPAGRGLQRMVGWARELFSKRLEDDFFELTAVGAAPDLAPLIGLLSALPTCPVVQEIEVGTDSHELLYFSETEIQAEAVQEIGAAQSLLHLTDAHIATGTFAATSAVVSRKCLFANACRAPLAIANSPICLQRPWESFSSIEPEGCWYSQGVAASRGRADL